HASWLLTALVLAWFADDSRFVLADLPPPRVYSLHHPSLGSEYGGHSFGGCISPDGTSVATSGYISPHSQIGMMFWLQKKSEFAYSWLLQFGQKSQRILNAHKHQTVIGFCHGNHPLVARYEPKGPIGMDVCVIDEKTGEQLLFLEGCEHDWFHGIDNFLS